MSKHTTECIYALKDDPCEDCVAEYVRLCDLDNSEMTP